MHRERRAEPGGLRDGTCSCTQPCTPESPAQTWMVREALESARGQRAPAPSIGERLPWAPPPPACAPPRPPARAAVCVRPAGHPGSGLLRASPRSPEEPRTGASRAGPAPGRAALCASAGCGAPRCGSSCGGREVPVRLEVALEQPIQAAGPTDSSQAAWRGCPLGGALGPGCWLCPCWALA